MQTHSFAALSNSEKQNSPDNRDAPKAENRIKNN